MIVMRVLAPSHGPSLPGLLLGAPARHQHVDVARGQHPTLYPGDLEPVLQVEPGQILGQLLAREPQVEQRTDEHVPGDPGEGVEVQHPSAFSHPGGRALLAHGAAFGGVAALLGMLTSCASNVTVVNIDNGFGAAYVATLINRL